MALFEDRNKPVNIYAKGSSTEKAQEAQGKLKKKIQKKVSGAAKTMTDGVTKPVRSALKIGGAIGGKIKEASDKNAAYVDDSANKAGNGKLASQTFPDTVLPYEPKKPSVSKKPKIGGNVENRTTGLASNRESDELLYGEEGRIVGGNSDKAKAALGPVDHGKVTNVTKGNSVKSTCPQEVVYTNVHGGAIGRGSDRGSAPLPRSENPRIGGQSPGIYGKQELGNGLDVTFDKSIPQSVREEFVSNSSGEMSQEESDRRALGQKQWRARQGFVEQNPAMEGLLTSSNAHGLSDAERLAYNNKILQNRGSKYTTDSNNDASMARLGVEGQQAESLQRGQNEFTGSESEKQRKFLGGQQANQQAFTAEQNDMNREQALNIQKGDIAGKAFIGGMAGNDVQQLENSNPGNVEYANKKMPGKKDTSTPWTVVKEKGAGGIESVTGSFNRQTNEFRPRIGGVEGGKPPQQVHKALDGVTPDNMTPENKEYLANLGFRDPVEYQRVMNVIMQRGMELHH